MNETDLLKTFLNKDVVDSFMYFLGELDAYEERKERQYSDEKFLLNGYRLFKEGKLSYTQFVQVCELLAQFSEGNTARRGMSKECKQALQAIERSM